VKDLLSNYGQLGVLWWDTPVSMTPERVAKFLPLLKLQPQIITNNRLDKDICSRYHDHCAGRFSR